MHGVRAVQEGLGTPMCQDGGGWEEGAAGQRGRQRPPWGKTPRADLTPLSTHPSLEKGPPRSCRSVSLNLRLAGSCSSQELRESQVQTPWDFTARQDQLSWPGTSKHLLQKPVLCDSCPLFPFPALTPHDPLTAWLMPMGPQLKTTSSRKPPLTLILSQAHTSMISQTLVPSFCRDCARLCYGRAYGGEQSSPSTVQLFSLIVLSHFCQASSLAGAASNPGQPASRQVWIPRQGLARKCAQQMLA